MLKKFKINLFLLLIVITTLSFSSCKFINNIFGNDNSNLLRYEEEFTSSSGKWILKDDTDTYFMFDGTKNKMSFIYVEDGTTKYNGNYKALYRGNGKDILSPLTFTINRTDKSKTDTINCYVDDFKENFTQFTIMGIEEDLGMIDGTVYTHIYRISELPYKLGTYILEGNDFKTELNNYSASNRLHIADGTYTLSTGESFTFKMSKPMIQELFQYKNGDIIIEGSFYMNQEKNTIYLYITHDPYEKVTNEDKKDYDTTFSIHYPPDFYLYGDFSNQDYIIIDSLYHHTESKTTINDSDWVFGKYIKK